MTIHGNTQIRALVDQYGEPIEELLRDVGSELDRWDLQLTVSELAFDYEFPLDDLLDSLQGVVDQVDRGPGKAPPRRHRAA